MYMFGRYLQLEFYPSCTICLRLTALTLTCESVVITNEEKRELCTFATIEEQEWRLTTMQHLQPLDQGLSGDNAKPTALVLGILKAWWFEDQNRRPYAPPLSQRGSDILLCFRGGL